MPISPITEIIDELRRGRMVVLMDDEDRENEGDLVIAAAHVRGEDVNFMATHGRGLICLTLTPARCEQLKLPLQHSGVHRKLSTAFTVSIEAAHGVTTGISAADRATTIHAAIRPDATPDDVVTPGHIFPLMARTGGVLARAGHTEAGCDLARLPQLAGFAQRHGLKIGTIADLIRYRMETESSIQRVSDGVMPTPYGDFRVVAYHDDIGDAVHLALVKGEVRPGQSTLVRVHVQESLLDLFTLAHRAGTWTLPMALARVAAEGEGVVVILQQSESPQQLMQRLEHFYTQATGQWPHGEDRVVMRTHGLGSQILADLGVRRMRVLGHAMKAPAMSGFGLDIVEYLEASAAPVTALEFPVPQKDKDKKAKR